VTTHLELNAFQNSNDNRDLQINVLRVRKSSGPDGDQTQPIGRIVQTFTDVVGYLIKGAAHGVPLVSSGWRRMALSSR
jgi:hypothetical protein